MPDFDPSYPTPGAQAYRDGFEQGAAEGGLRAIPDDILSWAIDRAIQARKPPKSAGMTFADVYFRVSARREPREGVTNPKAYLLGAYEKELRQNLRP